MTPEAVRRLKQEAALQAVQLWEAEPRVASLYQAIADLCCEMEARDSALRSLVDACDQLRHDISDPDLIRPPTWEEFMLRHDEAAKRCEVTR